MRDNKRGTIEDRAVDEMLGVGRPEIATPRETALYIELTEVRGILERFFIRAADAKDITDVNIAAGRAGQELARVIERPL